MEKTAVGERKNEAFMSTLVTADAERVIVTATGMQSEIGKVASMIRAVPREYTPLQKKLAELGETAQCRFHLALCAVVRDCGPAKAECN